MTPKVELCSINSWYIVIVSAYDFILKELDHQYSCQVCKECHSLLMIGEESAE